MTKDISSLPPDLQPEYERVLKQLGDLQRALETFTRTYPPPTDQEKVRTLELVNMVNARDAEIARLRGVVADTAQAGDAKIASLLLQLSAKEKELEHGEDALLRATDAFDHIVTKMETEQAQLVAEVERLRTTLRVVQSE